MKDRVFRLMEHHQKIDELLRLVQLRPLPDRTEIARLRLRKLSIKDRLLRLARSRSAITL